MKTITYNGSSKVIKRIVELLNRKAPLPLDGDGDPDWGTNGQVLATDGSGATSWKTTSTPNDGVLTIKQNGTTVGTFSANQSTNETINLTGGGGGGGGHTIENASGTSMTQRDGLQFVDAHLADDSVNDRTKVEVVKETTEVAFDALDETDIDNDGFYAFEISGGTVIDASQVAYDGGTVKGALDGLKFIDMTLDVNESINSNGDKTFNLGAMPNGYIIVGCSHERTGGGNAFELFPNTYNGNILVSVRNWYSSAVSIVGTLHVTIAKLS